MHKRPAQVSLNFVQKPSSVKLSVLEMFIHSVTKTNNIPDLGPKNPVHVLVERPGSVVAGPVVIVPVCVSEEIAGETLEHALVVASDRRRLFPD